eukprot:gnl/TRDRNA2_/TRDRNA2_27631_c0_seq1.p1 gnl/TRDRNA2_/TRDRNA2_27631_c0~~gnl/TRDRNA2_/TRDRNA2_27631_c0_seq1.p1  ORF type:complete len:257 (+),score=27.30 gnl/TRDRNA2_/TRDRNA2_27631_c0_seq1:210-980(+)
MCYKSHGVSNADLIRQLCEHRVLSSERVKNVMLQVDRREFCPDDEEAPYADRPKKIGYNATISAPHMHVRALEALIDCLKPGQVALDVGCGSGYLTVCMALLVGDRGRVVGVDHIPELVEWARANVCKSHASLLSSGSLQLMHADGRQGMADLGPYDAIHCGAAALESVAVQLAQQLRPGGVMVIPVRPNEPNESSPAPTGDAWDKMAARVQRLYIYRRRLDGEIFFEEGSEVRYVCLTDEASQRKGDNKPDCSLQ